MGFMLPNFNLLCSQWEEYDPSVTRYDTPRNIDIPCNLTPGKRVMVQSIPRYTVLDGQGVYAFPMELLIPTGEKVWLDANGVGPCLFEVEQGSGKLYLATYVDFIGKGFANEHMFVILHRYAQDVVFADTTITVPFPFV